MSRAYGWCASARIAKVAAAVVLASGAGVATAQQAFPVKPVRIVTSQAGGGSDFTVRLMAQGLTEIWGQPVVVDNRGGGIIAGEIVSRAPPDGYTLIYYGSTLWLLPLIRKDVPYDTAKDFAPVIEAVSTPAILVAHPGVPVRSVQDLIALAKAKPGALNYGSAAVGTATHMSMELFKHLAGIDILRVPYKGTGGALNDLLGGRVQLMFAVAAAVATHVRTGKLRALGITSSRPSPAFPNLPTIASAGVPGYEALQFSGVFAPAKTPRAIVERLNADMRRVLNSPGVRERVTSSGAEIAAGSPEDFAKRIRTDVAVLGKVIRAAGIREE